MISWVDDNLSRFVLSDGPSSTWGRAGSSPAPHVIALPNRAVKPNDGIFLVTGAGEDSVTPHPDGQGLDPFRPPRRPRQALGSRGLVKLYVYRLEGVQMKNLR